MTGPPGGVRASDADRDEGAEVLADAVADGRLSIAEHSRRLDALYAAVTQEQMSAVIADLPERAARRGAIYQAFDPYRCVVIGGSGRRAGRFRTGRFCMVVAVFGTVRLDLRAARLSQEEVTVTVWGLGARVSLLIPVEWRVRDQALALGPHHTVTDGGGSEGAPLLRLRGVCLGTLHLARP